MERHTRGERARQFVTASSHDAENGCAAFLHVVTDVDKRSGLALTADRCRLLCPRRLETHSKYPLIESLRPVRTSQFDYNALG